MWTPYSPCLTGRDSAIYHAGNLLPSLSPGIKQSPKQIKWRPAVATGAAAEAARPLAAPLAPRATKEQTVIPTWLFCRGPHGALIKTGQTLQGGRGGASHGALYMGRPQVMEHGGSAGPSPSPLQQHPPCSITCGLPMYRAPGNQGDGRVGDLCFWVRGPQHAGRGGKSTHVLYLSWIHE